jgi:hypothetical protein
MVRDKKTISVGLQSVKMKKNQRRVIYESLVTKRRDRVRPDIPRRQVGTRIFNYCTIICELWK